MTYRIRRQWTWPEVAWILARGGRARLERLMGYERDIRETKTPPLVAWAVDKWLKEHEAKPAGEKVRRPVKL